LRFRDLQERGIVASWPQLKNLMRKRAFPIGFMLSPNARCWHEAEVDAWLASRPVAGPKLRGAAKTRAAAAKAKRAAAKADAEHAANP
jgi:hypothetical protein